MVPVGLSGQTGNEIADMKIQWLICDFGRRMGLYNQAGLASDIAQLQTEFAYQTVANEAGLSLLLCAASPVAAAHRRRVGASRRTMIWT